MVDALDRTVEALWRPDAVPGPVELVFLSGEPGIGKTATARRTAEAAQRLGARVAWGTCWDGDGVPAFWPWSQLLRALVRDGAIGAGADLAPLTGEPAPGEGERFRTFVAVSEALEHAGTSPLLLVLDDLQWADAASLRLLDFVSRHCRQARLLIIATFRDVDPAPGEPLRALLADLSSRAASYALSGLSEAETAALLADLGTVDESVAAAVHARTGGNPFFVQETARLLADGAAQSVPLGVGEAIARRLGALPPPMVAVLRASALIGASFATGVLASVADLSDVDTVAALDRAVGIRVLRSDGSGRYRFEHDLFRETLAAQVDPADRAGLHARIARALEASGAGNAELAFHYGQSGDVEPALRYTRAAASDAAAALAHEEATRLRRQVIALGDDSPGAQLALADAARQSGEYAPSRAAYEAAAREPALLGPAALGLHELGGGSERSHQFVIDLLERAVSSVDDQTAAPGRCRLLAALARELADGPHRDPARAAALADQAVAAARSAEPGALAFCLFAKHDAIWGPGSPAARLALAEEMADAAGDDLEMAFQAALCWLIALLDLGDARAPLALAQMRRVAERSRLPRHRYLVASREAAIAAMQGRFADARYAIETADALGEMIGEPDAVGVRMTQLLVMGMTREGVAGGKRFFDTVGRFSPPEFGPETQAIVLAAQGDPGGGAAVLAASVPALRRSQFRWRALAALAFDTEVLVLADAPEQTAQAYDDLLPYADEVIGIGGATAIIGPVALYLGLLAAALRRYADATTQLEQAVTVARRLGARPVLARAQAELGLCLLAQGDQLERAEGTRPERAEALLAEAAAIADELDLPLVTARLAQRPVASGNRMRRDGPVWTLEYAGRSAHLPDSKGLRDLATLVSAPGEEIAATALVSEAPVPGSDEVLDERARSAYRARLEALDAELDRAALRDRRDAVAQLTAEREALIAELSRAYGLGGRARRLGDLGERARTTVTARIRDTLRKIEQVHPELGVHLRESVSTGRSCSYRPPTPTRWVVSHGV
jgi:tetratricopeptide (TPR) repeat protein